MVRSNSRPSRRLALCTALLGCALAGTLALSGCEQSFQSAAQALNDGIVADMEQLTGLTSETAQSLFDSDYTRDLLAAGVDPIIVYGPMFSSLSYEVGAISIQDNVATVTVTVTNKDLTTAFQNYTAVVTNELATASSREALASLDDAGLTAHLANVLADCLNDPGLGTLTQTVELSYCKQGATWELQNGEALSEALLGNLSAVQAGLPSEDQLAAAGEVAAGNVAQIGAEAQPSQE